MLLDPADREDTARPIQENDVARIDQVGITDLLLVEAPQLGPAPGRIGIALRDSPERVSGNDYISVRRVWFESERRGRRLAHDGAGKKEETERCDRLTELLDHGDPSLSRHPGPAGNWSYRPQVPKLTAE